MAKWIRELLRLMVKRVDRAHDETSTRVSGRISGESMSFDLPISDEEAVRLAGLLDLEELVPLRAALLDLIESAPSWPLWACLQYPSNSGIVELRLRLMARGYRPVEM